MSALNARCVAMRTSVKLLLLSAWAGMLDGALGEGEEGGVVRYQFVDNVWDLKSAVHYGVQHVILNKHVDFTPVPLDGWWYHLKAEATLETVQGECGDAPPSVPEGTPALRLLMPKQCVILHDADLFGFVTRTPSHLWFAHLYFRVVRSKRSVRPFAITLHDGAWAFLDEVTFQGDGEGGSAVGISVASTDQAYLKKCLFADMSCDGCPTAAVIAGTVDFEECTFDNLHSGNGTDTDGLVDGAAIYVHAYGSHATHKFGVGAPMVRVVGSIFKDLEPHGILTGPKENPRDPPSVAYLDDKARAELGPNSTAADIKDTPKDRFLLGDHEWYLAEKEEAVAILNGEFREEVEKSGLGKKIGLYIGVGVATLMLCLVAIAYMRHRGKSSEALQAAADNAEAKTPKTMKTKERRKSQSGTPTAAAQMQGDGPPHEPESGYLAIPPASLLVTGSSISSGGGGGRATAQVAAPGVYETFPPPPSSASASSHAHSGASALAGGMHGQYLPVPPGGPPGMLVAVPPGVAVPAGGLAYVGGPPPPPGAPWHPAGAMHHQASRK